MSPNVPPPGNRPSPGPSPSGYTPQGPPPGPARPPLRRRRDGKLLAGVLVGVADHLGIDVAVARILFVALTVLTQGLFLVAYLLGWVFIPEETDAEAAVPRPVRNGGTGGRDPLFWVGVGIVIFGALWLIDLPLRWFGPFRFGVDSSLLVPLVLIAFGIALWRATDRAPSSTPPPVHRGMPPTETAMSTNDPSDTETVRIDAPATAGSAPTRPSDDPVTTGAAAWSPPPPDGPPTAHGGDGRDWTPPPVPPSRSVLARATVGVAVLTVGVLWLLDVADVTAFGPGRIVSAALLVLGVGLLVGSVFGRARSLIAVGLVVLPAALLLQVVQPVGVDMFRGSPTLGNAFESPTDESVVRDGYQVAAGQVRVDLSGVVFTEDRDLVVQAGFGQVRVVVPADVDVEVTGRVGAGELTLFDRRSDGVGLDRIVLDEVEGSRVRLRLDVNVGFGEATVVRATEPPAPAPDGDDAAADDVTDDEELES